MIFTNNVYVIYVDGNFVGVTEEYDYISDIAQDGVNGVSEPILDDDFADRVDYYKINVNRYCIYDSHNCSDKLSDDSIMCYDLSATINCMNVLNRLNLEKERAEAKLRASAL